MNNIELNINNYSFDDILNLFKINKNFTQNDLKKCKETVEKLQKSSLNKSYYELFNKAYTVLEDKYNTPKEDKDKPLYIPPSYPSSQPLTIPHTILPNITSIPNTIPQPTYSTKMLTIHTEDRDIIKYPSENSFEIKLPSMIKNTLSIELFDITLPTFYYNISDYLQNTKVWFSIPFYFTDPIEITMASGYYTYTDICTELAKQLNSVTTKKLFDLGIYVSPLTQYTNFSITFNGVERKFTFYNQDQYILWFDTPSTYDNCSFNSWKMLNNWGLPYNLGFYKNKYESTTNSNTYVVTSDEIAILDMYTTIYMEIDTFNWIDEIIPYSISTTDNYNNDFNGSVNNSFAKLILSNVSNSYVLVDKFKRILPHVVEKIGRLKFKFRYHNGILVDFNHQPFNFALKIECKFNS